MNPIEPQRLLAVGIDTASRTHHAVVMRFPEQLLLDQEFDNRRDAFLQLDQRVQALAQLHGLTVVYGIEGSGSYGRTLADFLLAQGRDVREVQAMKVNRQKAFYGQDKSDRLDARAAAAIVLRASPQLPKVPQRDETIEAIRKTSRYLDQLVQEQTRHLNQLHAALLETYQALAKTLFEDLAAKTALSFFQTFPEPSLLQGLSTTKLAHFLAKSARGKLGHGKGSPAWKKAEQILEQTQPLQTAPPSPGHRLQAQVIQALCQQILSSKEIIRTLTHSLEKELLPQTGMKLQSFTGIDVRAAAILLGETRDGHRFASPDAYARYNGTAPREHSTGGKIQHRGRKDCNHRLKRIFYLIALVNAQHDPLGIAYYQACQQRGLSPHQALKRLARRISDILYAMMRDQSAYDPARARASMERRQGGAKKTGGGARTPAESETEKSLPPPVGHSITEEVRC